MAGHLLVARLRAAEQGRARGLIVALHGSGGDVGSLLPLCEAAATAFDILALEGPRTVTPYTVQSATPPNGYEWYPGEGAQVAELARFGHALWAVERAVSAARAQAPARPVHLLGHGQGAVIALTLAALIPEWLTSVVSLAGDLPEADGWTWPGGDLAGLPIMLAAETEAAGRRTAKRLQGFGAAPLTRLIARLGDRPMLAADAMERWLADGGPVRARGSAPEGPTTV